MAALDGSILIDEQKQDFTLKEEMFYDLFGDDSKQKFPKERAIRLHIEKAVDLRGVLTFFDRTLLSAVGSCTDVTRWLRCSKCRLNKEVGYFHCKENFELSDEMERCVPLRKHDKDAKDVYGRNERNGKKDCFTDDRVIITNQTITSGHSLASTNSNNITSNSNNNNRTICNIL